MVLAVLLIAAVISTDAKLFKKKKWLKKLPLLKKFGVLPGGLPGIFGGAVAKPEITVDHPRIVEIVKHVPVIQKVEVIKPVEIIRTIQVPGKNVLQHVNSMFDTFTPH